MVEHGELCSVPGFVQDIERKKTDLGDAGIHSPVRKILIFLEPADKIAQFLPGNIHRHLVEDVVKIVQISTDIGGIRCNSMVSKTTEGNHFPESI